MYMYYIFLDISTCNNNIYMYSVVGNTCNMTTLAVTNKSNSTLSFMIFYPVSWMVCAKIHCKCILTCVFHTTLICRLHFTILAKNVYLVVWREIVIFLLIIIHLFF